MKLNWYNYKKETWEDIECPLDFSEYIPQSTAAQNLYNLYVKEMKYSPLEAAIKILKLYTKK